MTSRYFLSLLSCLIFVSRAQAQDCTAPVGGDNMDLKDGDILLQAFPDGIRVTFVCNVGYVSAGGSGAVTCTAGNWNPVRLKCERRSCGSAGEVLFGSVDYPEGNEFGDKIVITCDKGFNLLGKREITCGSRGWQDRLPLCEVVVCDPPATVLDGSFSPQRDEYEYQEAVLYRCQKDFTLTGARTLACSEDGTFKPDPPECTKVDCPEPDIENAELIRGDLPPYGFRSMITYGCLPGYKMEGARTLKCEIDSNWSPALPKCERALTPTKPPITTTTAADITTANTTTTTTVTPTGSDGSTIAKGVGGFFAALVLCVALFFGGRKLMEKMKGSGIHDADKKAPKPDEEIALSDQKGPEEIPADEREARPPLDSSAAMNENNNI